MVDWPSIDWELVFKTLGVVFAALVSIYQIRSLVPPSRARLKADLEILKLLDPSDEAVPFLKAHTARAVRRLYPPVESAGSSLFKVHSWGDFMLGLIFLPGFSIWTFYLIKHGSYWWAPLTGLFAFAGFGAILNGLDPKSAKKKGHTDAPSSESGTPE